MASRSRWIIVVGVTLVLSLAWSGGAEGSRSRSGNLIVAVGGDLAPHSLPREGTAPVSIKVQASFSTVNREPPPELRRIRLRIGNKGNLIDDAGLPACPEKAVQNTSASGAMEVCGRSLVGHGHFAADLVLPGQDPVLFQAAFLIFNARSAHGRHVILGSVHSRNPPVSFLLPFELHRGTGAFGSTLTATIPRAASKWARITHFDMKIQRRYRSGGKSRSYINAGCPAPEGFPGVVFPLFQATFEFAPKHRLTAAVIRTCQALGGRNG